MKISTIFQWDSSATNLTKKFTGYLRYMLSHGKAKETTDIEDEIATAMARYDD